MTHLNDLIQCSDEQFVRNCYHLILDRAPDQGGFASYVLSLKRGRSRVQIARSIARSAEARARGARVEGLSAAAIWDRILRISGVGPLLNRLAWSRDANQILQRIWSLEAACTRLVRIADDEQRQVAQVDLADIGDVPPDWAENVGTEARKSFARWQREGFIRRYLSGRNILDIGYKGYTEGATPIMPSAIGIDLDYPGYDGRTLPFADGSQDTVFASHVLEHIDDYRNAISDWFRVLKLGGFLIIAVPHQYLYDRQYRYPARWAWLEHKRFYTAASLLAEVSEALNPLDYRVRVAEDNDRDFDYDVPVEQHAVGGYEVLMVLEKVQRVAITDEVEINYDSVRISKVDEIEKRYEYLRDINENLLKQNSLLSVFAPEDLPFSNAHVDAWKRIAESPEPDDRDFIAFRQLGDKPVVCLDLGANIGNSALGFAKTLNNPRIFCVEANPSLRKYLEMTKEVLAGKAELEYFIMGLGETGGNIQFQIPKIAGCYVIGEASFSPEYHTDPRVVSRLSSYTSDGVVAFVRANLPVMRFDDLFDTKIEPMIDFDRAKHLIVKIDVEGFEMSVLKGMTSFLRSRKPMLLVEPFEVDPLARFLEEFGYRRYAYSVEADVLHTEGTASSNYFFLLPEHLDATGSRLV